MDAVDVGFVGCGDLDRCRMGSGTRKQQTGVEIMPGSDFREEWWVYRGRRKRLDGRRAGGGDVMVEWEKWESWATKGDERSVGRNENRFGRRGEGGSKVGAAGSSGDVFAGHRNTGHRKGRGKHGGGAEKGANGAYTCLCCVR